MAVNKTRPTKQRTTSPRGRIFITRSTGRGAADPWSSSLMQKKPQRNEGSFEQRFYAAIQAMDPNDSSRGFRGAAGRCTKVTETRVCGFCNNQEGSFRSSVWTVE